jgi:hypothetical protein
MSIFDACLDNFFGSWIIDYVEEVVGDRLLTSHDPSEAQLLDGEFVLSWCSLTLHKIEANTIAILKSEQMFQDYQSKDLYKDLGKIYFLCQILAALERIKALTRFASAG